jgi:hypothetical protein
MGAQGADVFEDTASVNWLEGDYATSGASAVADALDTAAGRPVTEVLERDEGARARAAAEVVAVACGDLPEEINSDHLAMLNAHGSDVRAMADPKGRARAALERLISENSVLHEAWTQGDHQSDWVAALNDLRRRLR